MSITRQDIDVYLINLDRATDRLAGMTRRLQALDLPYIRFAAVDGRAMGVDLMTDVDPQAFARNTGRPPLPGDIGCYHSHMSVWSKLIKSGKPAALILEDDIVFHDDFPAAVSVALENIASWDIVRFNCIRAKRPLLQERLGRYRLNAYVGPFTGNGAYLITRDTALKLGKSMWPITRPHDHELNRFFAHDIRLLGLEPWSSHPDDAGQSTITGTAFADVKKPRWYKRLPYLWQKTANYVRRAAWLYARRG